MAALIFAQIALGLAAVSWRISPTKLNLLVWHKSIGILILSLLAPRPPPARAALGDAPVGARRRAPFPFPPLCVHGRAAPHRVGDRVSEQRAVQDLLDDSASRDHRARQGGRRPVRHGARLAGDALRARPLRAHRRRAAAPLREDRKSVV